MQGVKAVPSTQFYYDTKKWVMWLGRVKRELPDPPFQYAAEGKPTCDESVGISQPFEILEVQTREFSRFNTRGTQWKVGLNPPPETPLRDPVM